MTETVPEPPHHLSDPKVLLVEYLDYFRAAILCKLEGLSEEEARQARLPSGWTPLDLLTHLTHMERRWFTWDFAGKPVENPWGDWGETSHWEAPPDQSREALVQAFHAECERSRAIVASAGLDDKASGIGRFAPPKEPPVLAWVLFHVLQEYARHAGHLDIVCELAGGPVGE